MKEFKLTPGQRSALKLKIIRKANEDPEFAKRVQKRLDEIAIEREIAIQPEPNKSQTTNGYKQTAIYFLRWLGVLPGSIIGFLLATMITWGLFNIIIFTTGDYAILKLICYDIIGSGYTGIAFVATGFFIAPSFKKEVSIILTLLFAIAMSLSVFLATYVTYDNLSIIMAISAIVGAVYACFKCIRLKNPL
ncbi:hypothetical protein [Salegentibacter sp. Hel_I_6]|uniref:hypothetical protein n=1 Tax=Salegentibacter sp. Hel_I_6 TaxID=1250278 RepID=UPI0005614577|nr:hypothetical protein [Salegentibacter sp. Hel_I_6]